MSDHFKKRKPTNGLKPRKNVRVPRPSAEPPPAPHASVVIQGHSLDWKAFKAGSIGVFLHGGVAYFAVLILALLIFSIVVLFRGCLN